MIIEDDLVIAEHLKENLEELGYKVPEIISSFSELKKISSLDKIDLAIVDIHLNGSKKDGIEIVDQLSLGSKIPIIYLTAYADEQTTNRAKITQPSAYLIKPASKQQINVAIDFAMDAFMKKTEVEPSVPSSKLCPLYSGNGTYFAKIGERYERIVLEDIVMIKASGSYSTIMTANKDYTISANLKSVLGQLSYKHLLRTHRSYAVNRNFVQSFDEDSLYMIRGAEVHCLPLGNTYKKDVLHFLPKIKAD